MNTRRHLLLLLVTLGLPAARAQLTIPGDGSDGVFAPVANIEVDLSLATTGAWDMNNSANAGNGVYDASKWAVTFKYASVNIPAGVTVTFKNHPSRAPVVWLVQGNVNVAGTIDLSGKPGTTDAIGRLIPTEPGPGGFRGGVNLPSGASLGFGIGGSGFGTATYAGTYGNAKIMPLIGGSGSGYGNGSSGSGGAGAILIASSQTILIDGTVIARPVWLSGSNYPGSGGAIRILAATIAGTGVVDTLGGDGNGAPFAGRIRLESLAVAPTLRTFPETVSVAPGSIPEIWPPATAPSVTIFSIDGVAAPAEPLAPFVNGADTQISKNSSVPVVLKTKNFPIQGNVQVRWFGKSGGGAWVVAGYSSGDFSEALWSADITFPSGFSALQARATMP